MHWEDDVKCKKRGIIYGMLVSANKKQIAAVIFSVLAIFPALKL